MQPQNPYQPPQGQPTPPAQPQPQTTDTSGQVYASPQPTPTAGTTSYPVDYLNQIAVPTAGKKLRPAVVFGLIGGVLIAAAIALFVLVQSAAGPSVSSQLYAAQARLDTIVRVTNEQGSHLTQNKLSSINSTLSTTTTSMQANLASYLANYGYKNATAAAAAKKTETAYYTKLSQTFSDSYLTGTLDRTYPSEMVYQLTILKSMLQKIKASANSKAFNDFYNQNVPTIDTMTQQLSAFQSTE